MGFSRILLFLTVLYWICAVKMAIVRASLGVWDVGQDPMTFLVCAALVYIFSFGFFWALLGFFLWPSRRY